jgi:hypothetical protein
LAFEFNLIILNYKIKFKIMYRDGKNNAQRARDDKRFHDSGATVTTDKYGTTTHYSDGSSTVDFGPMAGPVEYDENGEEC